MSTMFRLAPALLAVGLSFSSPAGHSAADCLPLNFNAVFPQLAQLGNVSSEEYSADLYIAAEDEECMPDCATNTTAALSSSDMPAPTHLPVVAAPDEVAAWHVEIFERVSQSRDHHELDHYCEL
jgi:hypothetical protein